MARRPLSPRVAPTFPRDTRELVHQAARHVRSSDTQFVRDAAAHRAAVVMERKRLGRPGESIEDMCAGLLSRVQRLEAQVRELGGEPAG